jgi:hypothetical protein
VTKRRLSSVEGLWAYRDEISSDAAAVAGLIVEVAEVFCAAPGRTESVQDPRNDGFSRMNNGGVRQVSQGQFWELSFELSVTPPEVKFIYDSHSGCKVSVKIRRCVIGRAATAGEGVFIQGDEVIVIKDNAVFLHVTRGEIAGIITHGLGIIMDGMRVPLRGDFNRHIGRRLAIQADSVTIQAVQRGSFGSRGTAARFDQGNSATIIIHDGDRDTAVHSVTAARGTVIDRGVVSAFNNGIIDGRDGDQLRNVIIGRGERLTWELAAGCTVTVAVGVFLNVTR